VVGALPPTSRYRVSADEGKTSAKQQPTKTTNQNNKKTRHSKA
jgi:hypothetical protein